MSVAWVSLAVTAGSAVYGGVQSNNANKANAANAAAQNKATQKSEKEARQLFNRLMKDYGESKEKLEGMSIHDYIGNMVTSLNNDELSKAYYDARNADWEMAQQWAERATEQNVDLFDSVIDSVGGGNYRELLEIRDQAILGDDIAATYGRARELTAPRQAAGSVVRSSDGTPVTGQRGDALEFSVAKEQILAQQERQFTRSSQAINDDRTAAERQQERAISFLPLLDYSNFTSTQVVQPFQQAQLQAQLAMLQTEASLASAAMGRAYTLPQAAPVASTAASDALVAQSVQSMAGQMAQMYANNSKSTTGTTAQQYSTAANSSKAATSSMNNTSGVIALSY